MPAGDRGRSPDRVPLLRPKPHPHRGTTSVPPQVRVPQPAAAHQFLAVLGAALQRRDHLAGIEQALGIEGALHGQHLRAFLGAELHAHGVELLDTDAVLAGDRAAHRDAGLQDVGAELLAPVQLVGIVGIEQDQRMQVAVAGMEHVGAPQPVLLLHLLDRQQDVRQPLARDGRVHAHVVGADAAGGGERVLAAAPEPQALGLVPAHGDGGGACVAQHLAHAADLFFDFLRHAIALAQQDGFGREVVSGMDEVLDRRRHRLVHHLQAGRDDAVRDDRGHRVAGFAQVVEAGHDAARQLGLGHQLHGDFGGHGEHALAAHQHAEQVVARRIERLAADLHRLALRGEAAHLQHVVEREPVLQAVHAARVLGHVAADGAGDLAGGIGRVVQALRRGCLADRQVAHAALHAGRSAHAVDGEDAVELCQRQRHAQAVRHGAARQAGARTACHHRDPQFMAGAQHALHLGLGLRQCHGQRTLAVSGESVAFVGPGLLRVPQQGMGRQHRAQRGQQPVQQRGLFAGGRIEGSIHAQNGTADRDMTG